MNNLAALRLKMTDEQYQAFCKVWSFADSLRPILDLTDEQMELAAPLFAPLDIKAIRGFVEGLVSLDNRLDQELWFFKGLLDE